MADYETIPVGYEQICLDVNTVHSSLFLPQVFFPQLKAQLEQISSSGSIIVGQSCEPYVKSLMIRAVNALFDVFWSRHKMRSAILVCGPYPEFVATLFNISCQEQVFSFTPRAQAMYKHACAFWKSVFAICDCFSKPVAPSWGAPWWDVVPFDTTGYCIFCLENAVWAYDRFAVNEPSAPETLRAFGFWYGQGRELGPVFKDTKPRMQGGVVVWSETPRRFLNTVFADLKSEIRRLHPALPKSVDEQITFNAGLTYALGNAMEELVLMSAERHGMELSLPHDDCHVGCVKDLLRVFITQRSVRRSSSGVGLSLCDAVCSFWKEIHGICDDVKDSSSWASVPHERTLKCIRSYNDSIRLFAEWKCGVNPDAMADNVSSAEVDGSPVMTPTTDAGMHLVINVPRGREIDVRQQLLKLVQASIDWCHSHMAVSQAVTGGGAAGALVPSGPKGHPMVVTRLKEALVFVHRKSLEADLSDRDRALALEQKGHLAGLLLRVWQEPVGNEARVKAVVEDVLREAGCL